MLSIAKGTTLLERDDFRAGVFARDKHRCVVCGAEAQDAHHLIERRLWPDGGYYLANGVSLCAEHHLAAEQTVLSPEELRAAAGIKEVLLPPQFSESVRIDKWGNEVLASGQRLRGELFDDKSVQKVLGQAGVLEEFAEYVKYPRTPHLSRSPGFVPQGDLQLSDDLMFQGKQIVVTEKVCGENASIYRDRVHARSLDSGYHPSRTWIKQLQARIGHEIPEGWRLCGENAYAKHSIYYDSLPSYFLLFSIWNEHNVCLSWPETEEWAELLGLTTVPVLYRGDWDAEKVYSCYPRPQLGDESEGFVVRNQEEFSYSDFRSNVAKFVREGHVDPGSTHWMHGQVTPNKLAVEEEL